MTPPTILIKAAKRHAIATGRGGAPPQVFEHPCRHVVVDGLYVAAELQVIAAGGPCEREVEGDIRQSDKFQEADTIPARVHNKAMTRPKPQSKEAAAAGRRQQRMAGR